MRSVRIAPSLLASDFAAFGGAARACDEAGAEYLHFDIMDGHFVPNITFGPGVVRALRRHSRAVFDVHLMIERPELWVEDFVKAGADIVTVHAEACIHLQRVLSQIRAAGARAGVALNPATTIDCLQYVLEDIDLVLVMTVNPGFGGQSFIPAMVDKIRRTRDMLDSAGVTADLEVDGGIAGETARTVVDAGADLLVAGSSIFSHADGVVGGVRALRGAFAPA